MPPADLSPLDPSSDDTGLIVEVEILHRAVARLDTEVVGLRRAMASRTVIDQAKGVLRALTGASDEEAFAVLATRSQRANRKLVDVAADVLAAVDAPDRTAEVLAFLAQPDHRRARPDKGHDISGTGSWRTRRRWDTTSLSISDKNQLLALADLGENLAAAADLPGVLDVLLHVGADALGAFGAAVATLAGTGTAAVQTSGLQLDDATTCPLPLGASHPTTQVLRSGRHLVLSRSDLALRFPDHPLPERLRGLAVLALAGGSAWPAAWTLYLDRPVPSDRGTTAFLDRAARLAAAAFTRASRG